MGEVSITSEVQVLVCQKCSAAFLSETEYTSHSCMKNGDPYANINSNTMKSLENHSESSAELTFDNKMQNYDNEMPDKLIIDDGEYSGCGLDVKRSSSSSVSTIKIHEQYAQGADISQTDSANQTRTTFVADSSKGCIQKHIVLNTSVIGKMPASSQPVVMLVKPVPGSSKGYLVPIRPNLLVHKIQSAALNTNPRSHVVKFLNTKPVKHVISTVSPRNSEGPVVNKLPTRTVTFNPAMSAHSNHSTVLGVCNSIPQPQSAAAGTNVGRVVKIVPKSILKPVYNTHSQLNKSTVIIKTVASTQQTSNFQARHFENAKSVHDNPVGENLTSNQTSIADTVEIVTNGPENKTVEEFEGNGDDFPKQLVIDESECCVAEMNSDVSNMLSDCDASENTATCPSSSNLNSLNVHDENLTNQKSNNEYREIITGDKEKYTLSSKFLSVDEEPSNETENDISLCGEHFLSLSKRLSCGSSESSVIKKEVNGEEMEEPMSNRPVTVVGKKQVTMVIRVKVNGVVKKNGVAKLLKDPSIEKVLMEHVKRFQKDNNDQKSICINIQTSSTSSQPAQKSTTRFVHKGRAVSRNINLPVVRIKHRMLDANEADIGIIEDFSNRSLRSRRADADNDNEETVVDAENDNSETDVDACNDNGKTGFDADNDNGETGVDAGIDNAKTGVDVKPYVCQSCWMIMDSELELEAHHASCKGDICVEVKVEGFRCPVCSETFSDEASFDEHRQSCTAEMYNTSRLADIPAEFLNIGNNNLPECVDNISSSRTAYACGMCGKEFHRRFFLSRHMKVHCQEKDYTCPICGRGFTYKHNLKNHMGSHGDDRPYKCNECDATYKYPNNLSKHKTTHKPDDVVKKFRCRYCDLGFKENYHRERHEATHAPERTIECQHCDLTFSRRDNLQQHMKRIHSDEAERRGVKRKCHKRCLSCSVCGQKFLWRKYFVSHMEMLHPGVETSEFKQARVGVKGICDVSDDNDGDDDQEIDYDTDSDAEDIELDSEDDDKAVKNVKTCEKHSCLECDRVFRSEGNLQRHMRFMHDQD